MRRIFAVMTFCAAVLSGQSADAVLTGAVLDPRGAPVAAADVSAINSRTGVELRTAANTAGVYQFAALHPGLYRITAEHHGFRRTAYDGLVLAVGSRVTLNLNLELGELTESVEVRAEAPTLLASSSNSSGSVMTSQQLLELPLPFRSPIVLLRLTEPGVVGDNFNGSRRGALNITLDGFNIQDPSNNAGFIQTATEVSVDRIEEMRVVTSPADAEYGRGSGQVLMLTRSGTNRFHGALYANQANSALNANSWFNNLRGLPKNFVIQNMFGARIGGPLRRNKTFFHIHYEGQRAPERFTSTSITFTEQARRGQFRYFLGVPNGNANAAVPVVGLDGNPVQPRQAAGGLQTVNLFGLDPNRMSADSSGVVAGQTGLMPLPNDFRFGDGLNTAGYTWAVPSRGAFNQVNTRLDHYLNSAHRLNVSYSRERFLGMNYFGEPPFPGLPGGDEENTANRTAATLSSNLTPSVLHELRVGALRPALRFFAPWERGGAAALPRSGSAVYLPRLRSVSNPLVASDPQRRTVPLYQLSSSVTRLHSRHALKAGFEVRFNSANAIDSVNVVPRVNFGVGSTPVRNLNTLPGIGPNLGFAETILMDLAGSVDTIVQALHSPGGPNPVFLPGEHLQRTWRQREFSFYFKDEWKVTPSLTFNLGMRYEWYGVPWEANGKSAALAGGMAGLFGISGQGLADLFQPGRLAGAMTRVQLVGPNSPNPAIPLFQNDNNNLGPAVGLAWAIPWWGKDKTVFRLGYGISYERNALFLPIQISSAEPGLSEQRTFIPPAYVNLSSLRLPLEPLGKPLDVAPLTDRSQTVHSYDDRLRSPYIQNWNASLQRQVGQHMVIEARYAGSKGTRLVRTADINEVNIFENGILEAFRITQAGGHAPLLNRIFQGLNVPGLGVVDGARITGSDAIRAMSNTQSQLAHHSPAGLANYLNRSPQFTGVPGGLLRRAGLAENAVVANPQYGVARLASNFANSTYHALQLEASRRLRAGVMFRGNYTWSRTLGEDIGARQDLFANFRTIRDRGLDKKLLGFHRTHIVRMSGTWDLPLVRRQRGVLARILEHWQVGAIANILSGPPLTLNGLIGTMNMFGEGGVSTTVAIPKNAGNVRRTGNGVVYFDGWQQVPDPSIADLTTIQNLRGRSGMRAIADSSGRILLTNPGPGELGNVAPRLLELPGSFQLDLNLLKRITVAEGKTLQLRADASGVTNTPQFGAPDTGINSPTFGRITFADGGRIVVVGLRFQF